MRTTRWFVAISAIAALVVVGAPSAFAESYYNQVASQLGSHHVYVDPAASPTVSASQASSLEQEIASTGKPIYLILVDNGPTSTVPATSLPGLIHNAVGKPGVYAVSSNVGFYAQGFNVPAAIASTADAIAGTTMQQDAQQHGGKPVPYEVYTNYIRNLANVQVVTGSTSKTTITKTTTVKASKGSSDNALGITLLIIGILIVIGVIIWLVVLLTRRNRRNTSTYDSSYGASSYRAPSSSYGNTDDPVTLRKPTGNAGSSSTPSNLTVKQPGGGNVVINNTNYAPQSSMSGMYPHYYGGGFYGGMYFGAGYYQNPFWEWMIIDSMMENDGYGGDRDDSNQSSQTVTETDTSTTTTTTDTSAWGNTSSTYDQGTSTGNSGGDNWSGGYSAPDTSSSTPDYSSSGGGDWGGSSSPDYSSSGGSDFGSSGGDSGGGSW